jgi:A/G-specific adenine glycosylase
MHIRHELIKWYQAHKRNLPWRDTVDPYRIWMAEIIFQQTRIEQGIHYYHKFLERFPDVASLALASEDEVLLAWQGLGYYARARNMHRAAGEILRQYRGEFPGDYDRLRKLNGIGDYTAAAILSIAFGQPYAVVDGNVQRVFARLFALKAPQNSARFKKIICDISTMILDTSRPGTYNQAVMDFGAMVCKPARPACGQCPLAVHCLANRQGLAAFLPVKTSKRSPKERCFNYLVLGFREKGESYIYINKRTDDDIWKNLHDFPMVEAAGLMSVPEVRNYLAAGMQGNGQEVLSIKASADYHHQLTHRIIRARFFDIALKRRLPGSKLPGKAFAVTLQDIEKYARPRLIDKYLRDKSSNC